MNKLKIRLDKILIGNKKEAFINKKYPDEFEIAKYFKKVIIKKGFILSIDSWDKTLNAAKEIGIRHQDVSKEDWFECIDWCFGEEKKNDNWWGKVSVNNLGTVIKMYNQYKQSKIVKEKQNGRKRFNKY